MILPIAALMAEIMDHKHLGHMSVLLLSTWKWLKFNTILSQGAAFPSRLYVRPAKTYISLHIRAVW